MRNKARRLTSLVMALIVCISVSFSLNLPVYAAEVDYVYAGSYIKNWGVRGEDADFLSPNAEKFYKDNNTSYKALSSLQGSYNRDKVPTSDLYKELQKLMKSNHSHITDYGETRYLYPYTDCQNSAKTSDKISSFYSGVEIGPTWDSGKTWNREHTWPNSKGLAGDDENDIMMLRPTASSENSSRGNLAYGESSSFYDPNKESGGKYDVRGDVARIILYQYVRWGNTGYMWSSGNGRYGVIESREILLKWMELDPVDTWELGRNDSVESITGTRNVFVDFPELAFIMFGEVVPSNYTTPSGNAGFKITATSSNSKWGKVTVKGNTISAVATTGYEATGYTITSGRAKVTRKGDSFIVEPATDVSIKINFSQRLDNVVKFSENGEITGSEATYSGGSIKLPSNKAAVASGKKFVGWVTSTVKETTSKPKFYAAGSQFAANESDVLYALYSRTEGGKIYYFTSYISQSAKPDPNISSKPNSNTSSKPISNPSTCKHPNAEKIDKINPTCTSEGHTEGVYCSDCQTYLSGGKVISMIEHRFAGDCATFCALCKAQRQAAVEHKFDLHGVCTVCNEELISGDVSDLENEPQINNDSGSYIWIIVAVAAVLVISGGAAVAIMILKKKGKDE